MQRLLIWSQHMPPNHWTLPSSLLGSVEIIKYHLIIGIIMLFVVAPKVVIVKSPSSKWASPVAIDKRSAFEVSAYAGAKGPVAAWASPVVVDKRSSFEVSAYAGVANK